MEKALHLKKIADFLLSADPCDDWGKTLVNLAAVSALGLDHRWIAYEKVDDEMSDTYPEMALAA